MEIDARKSRQTFEDKYCCANDKVAREKTPIKVYDDLEG